MTEKEDVVFHEGSPLLVEVEVREWYTIVILGMMLYLTIKGHADLDVNLIVHSQRTP